MPRVLVNVMSNDWAVHFIGPDGKTRIGPWLLFDGPDEVRAILRWGNVSAEDSDAHVTGDDCATTEARRVSASDPQVRRCRGVVSSVVN